MSQILKILEDRIQITTAPAGAVCTLCDRKIPRDQYCLLLRAPVNLIITTKIVEEHACKPCAELIGNRMLFLVGKL